MIVLHGALLVGSSVLVYELRNVPSEFKEGKWVGFSLVNNMQTSLVALMLMFLIEDNPSIIFITKWFAVYWSSTLTLVLMFVPKIHRVHWVGEDARDLKGADELRRTAQNERRTSQWGSRIKQAARVLNRRSIIGALQPRESRACMVTYRGSAWASMSCPDAGATDDAGATHRPSSVALSSAKEVVAKVVDAGAGDGASGNGRGSVARVRVAAMHEGGLQTASE